MLIASRACNSDRHDRKAKSVSGWAMFVVLLGICLSGCSRSEATSSCKGKQCSVSHSMFADNDKPSECGARCVCSAVAIAREGLGLDPDSQKQGEGAAPKTIFESLWYEGNAIGSTIAHVPVADVIENVKEGPATPVVLVSKTGHLYVLLGAIRVNDKLLCQVVHGSESVSLLTKQALSEAAFQEAWQCERSRGVGVPIHVGSATIETDKLWHNFGETFPDKSLECTFRLKNVGIKTVILDKPVTSCQCTVPNLTEKREFAPGEVFDLKVMTRATSLASLRNTIDLALYEKGNGLPRQVQLSMIGSQRVSMEVTPTMLDFGIMLSDKSRSRTVYLRETPADRFVLKNVDSGKLPIDHKIETTKDRDGLVTYLVHLELKLDDKWTGEHREELRLTTDSYVRPRVTIPIMFQVEPSVRTMPSIISFGTIAVGESRQATTQLVARSGEPLIVQIESHPDECSVTLDQKKNPPVMIVAVKLKEPGIWWGAIKLNVRDSVGNQSISVKCVAYASQRDS